MQTSNTVDSVMYLEMAKRGRNTSNSCLDPWFLILRCHCTHVSPKNQASAALSMSQQPPTVSVSCRVQGRPRRFVCIQDVYWNTDTVLLSAIDMHKRYEPACMRMRLFTTSSVSCATYALVAAVALLENMQLLAPHAFASGPFGHVRDQHHYWL